MNSTLSLDDRVRTLISQVTAVPADQMQDGDRLREDLGMDSVASMELISMLSEELDVDVEMEEAAQVLTVGQVVALAKSRHVA
jgi:acyl carrier protein